MYVMREWSHLNRDEKDRWEEKARCILFPDLRGGDADTTGKAFMANVKTMAKALFKCHERQKTVYVVNKSEDSIIDDPYHTRWSIKHDPL